MSTRATLVLVFLVALAAGAACAFPGFDAAARHVAGHLPVSTDPDDPSALKLSTERVVVFKDGYALLVQRATAVADGQGRVFTHEPPEGAVLGTFWAAPVSDDLTIHAMRAQEREVTRTTTEEVPCASMAGILAASVDRQLTLTRGGRPEVHGTVVETLPAAGLIVVQTDGVRHLFPINSVTELTGADLPTRCSADTTTTSQVRELSFDLGAEAAGTKVELRLFSFAPGVRWIPTYRVHLAGEKAEIELTGEILNELTDIDGPVDFVVGVPHFKFKEVPSPLTLERVLRNALDRAAPGLMGHGAISNAAFSNAGFYETRAGEVVAAPATTPAPPAEVANADADELFVYSVEHLYLAKGGRASVPLLTAKASASLLYTVALNAGSGSGAGGVTQNPVWQSLRLTNDGDTPWTTGPALVLRAGLPLGQDLLTFTPPGQATVMPVTTATSVRATTDEVELSRTNRALSWRDRDFMRLDRRASVALHNTKDRAVEIEVTLRATGRPGEVSDEGAVQVIPTDSVDPQLVTRWRLTLKAGERREVQLEYSSHH